MSDFDEMLRIVRRNVRAIVVMLDTCHAGALGVARSRWCPPMKSPPKCRPAKDSSTGRIEARRRVERSAGSGSRRFYLLDLEGLKGKADGDGDGALSVSELFGYVAKRVPNLTGGQQHPYHKTEGTDLVLLTTKPETNTTTTPLGTNTTQTTSSPVLAADQPSGAVAPSVDRNQQIRSPCSSSKICAPIASTIGSPKRFVSLRYRTLQGQRVTCLLARAHGHDSSAGGADSLYTARELGVARLADRIVPCHRRDTAHRRPYHQRRQRVNEASDSVEGELDSFLQLTETTGAQHAATTARQRLGLGRRVDPNRNQYRRGCLSIAS